jgi:uncharacterized protein (DUF433 family)
MDNLRLIGGEASMKNDYIVKEAEAYRVRGTRISLDSLVYAFLRGDSPETIAQSFPELTLEQVYGSIAFYLASREAIDEYLTQGRVDYEALREESRQADPMFYQKLADAKNRIETTIS